MHYVEVNMRPADETGVQVDSAAHPSVSQRFGIDLSRWKSWA